MGKLGVVRPFLQKELPTTAELGHIRAQAPDEDSFDTWPNVHMHDQ